MEQAFLIDWSPIDFYAQVSTWMAADISAHAKFGGDMDAALGAIRARAFVMPCDTDSYFRVADNELEVARMPPADVAFVHAALKELLAGPGGI